MSPRCYFASLDFFIKKCRHDINKFKFNRYTKFSNLPSEERSALKSLKNADIVTYALDKGGAVVVGGPTSTKKKLCGNFPTPPYMLKSTKTLLLISQNIVKNTINDLIAKQ